ncbi:MAG: hypothetical protein WCQ00_04200, partial [bacterium]
MMKKINLKYTILTILLLVFVLGGVGKVAEARIWWTQGGGQNWTKIVTSADGTKLYAYLGSGSNEYIYTSTSSGMTWSPVTSLGMNKWIGIAMSSDGTKVVAAGNTSSYIYTSTSSGVTWATSTSAIGAKDWNCVGMSKSGSNIIAINNAGAFNNVAYVSTTTGNRWASSSLTGVNHYSCAVSSDGLGFFVTLMNTDFSNTLLSYSTFANISYSNNVLTGGTWSTDLTGIGGKIYITKGSVLYGSANNGLTWSTSTISSVTDYNTLSGSLDGIHLYAAGINGLYSSHDGGVNWILDSWFNQSQNMGSTRVSVVTSDDGSKVYSGLSVGSMSLALPVLSSPGTLISTSSTSISWTTDETSTSTISYGLAANVYTGILHYDPVMYDNFGTTTHSFNVTNLLPCTTYNYMYSATDKFWNTSSSPNYSFKTSGCIANTTYIQSTSTAISN